MENSELSGIVELKEGMEEFYFTFGQAHENTCGYPMKDHYVLVIAYNYGTAREAFCEWAKENMGAPDKWAFQYTSDKFQPEYFPAGEYAGLMCLKEVDDGV